MHKKFHGALTICFKEHKQQTAPEMQLSSRTQSVIRYLEAWRTFIMKSEILVFYETDRIHLLTAFQMLYFCVSDGSTSVNKIRLEVIRSCSVKGRNVPLP